MNEDTMVKCDSCGCAFAPAVDFRTDGEIQRYFMTCPYCGKQYLVAVTDAALRDQILAYRKMAEANKAERLSEPEQFAMQKLKETCVARSNELQKLYPLEVVGDEGE